MEGRRNKTKPIQNTKESNVAIMTNKLKSTSTPSIQPTFTSPAQSTYPNAKPCQLTSYPTTLQPLTHYLLPLTRNPPHLPYPTLSCMRPPLASHHLAPSCMGPSRPRPLSQARLLPALPYPALACVLPSLLLNLPVHHTVASPPTSWRGGSQMWRSQSGEGLKNGIPEPGAYDG